MPERRGVSTAEKRAMLEAAGEPWPTCECHGIPMFWAKNARGTAGGFWVCFEYKRENGRPSGRKYKTSEKGRATRRAYQRTYLGIPADEPVMSASEISARGLMVRRLKDLHNDPVAMALVERRNPKQAKLLRLAFHPGTPPYERRRALDRLINPPHQEAA